MRFSIIVPTLNCRAKVGTCLGSILGQSYGDLEIVVVDGGSADGTAELVSSLADPRIGLVQATGSSIYRAMNIGIANSSGEYLLFLGADDILYSASTLQELSPYATEGADLIVGNVLVGGKPFLSRIEPDLSFRHTVHHQGVLYRRNVFDRFGVFDDRFRLLGDFELNRRLIETGATVLQVDMFISRCGDQGVSKRRIWRLRLERLRLIKDWPAYLLSHWRRRWGGA